MWSKYRIISSAYNEILWLWSWILIDTSDFLMACAKGSRDRQNNKGESGHPCLVPRCKGNEGEIILLGMLRSIGRRSVSADHHILWLDRYSYIWPISCTDRNLMTSTRDDIYDAWGHMLQVNAGVEMLWCFEKQWKNRYMSCMFCMMIWWMDCSFLTADSVRADLRITARVSTGAGADRGRSMNIYL